MLYNNYRKKINNCNIYCKNKNNINNFKIIGRRVQILNLK